MRFREYLPFGGEKNNYFFLNSLNCFTLYWFLVELFLKIILT
jgi:hypothetical protein